MKKILLKKLQEFYSEKMAYAILSGNRKPKYEVIIALHKNSEVPFDAWLNIKSYLRENDTKQSTKHATAKGA